MTNAVLLMGCIVAAIAGAMHVHILVLENVLWSRRAVWHVV